MSSKACTKFSKQKVKWVSSAPRFLTIMIFFTGERHTNGSGNGCRTGSRDLTKPISMKERFQPVVHINRPGFNVARRTNCLSIELGTSPVHSEYTGFTPAKTQQLQSDLRELLAIPEPGSFKPGVTLSSKAQRDVLIERIGFESEPSIRVPGWFVKPAATNNQLPVALLIQDQGCDVLFDQFAFVEHLVRQGKAVCSIDLRTTGITTPNFPSSGPRFYRGEEPIAYPLVNLWNGTPIVGQQTTDLLACLRYLEHRPDVNPDRIALYTTGNSGLAGIFATALENRIRGLLLERSPLDLESIVAAERYKLPLSFFVFGLLKKFDLPEICSSIAPRPLLVANPVDSLGEAVTISDINVKYSIVQRAYTQSDQAGN